jgi:hypothetical protein
MKPDSHQLSDVTKLRMTEFTEMRVKSHEDANRGLTHPGVRDRSPRKRCFMSARRPVGLSKCGKGARPSVPVRLVID